LICLAVSLGHCAARKPANKPAPAKAAVVSVTPRVLTIVAGQPFEAVPSSGTHKLSLTLCPEEIGPATFTARSGKSLSGVSVVCGDLVGPGRITKQNVSVRLALGDDLMPSDAVSLDSTPRQFWVDVSVPRDTKAGVYKGAIAFFSGGKQFDATPIEVTVRPLRLIGSSKQYALYTTMGPSGEGSCALSGDAYSAFLRSAAALGFRGVAVCADPSRVGESLNACAGAGLVGMTPVLSFASKCPVPSVDDVKAIESARRAAGVSSAFYFCGCVDNQDIQAAQEKASILKRAGVQVAATVADDDSAQKLMPSVDGINYKVDSPYVQGLVNGGTNRTNKWEWYWWNARESVRANRINAGIGLWRSGLYGCMPMWMPSDAADHAESLDSVLCEALREGVNDTRYITTYMKALRELKDKKRASDKDYIASTEAYLSAFLAKPLDSVTPADLRGFRAKMAEFSAKLAARL